MKWRIKGGTRRGVGGVISSVEQVRRVGRRRTVSLLASDPIIHFVRHDLFEFLLFPRPPRLHFPCVRNYN